MNPLYNILKQWLYLDFRPSDVTKDDGQYFAANNGKRFIAFNCEPVDPKYPAISGVTLFSIREDGDTRTVFNGKIRTLEEAKLIWELTL